MALSLKLMGEKVIFVCYPWTAKKQNIEQNKELIVDRDPGMLWLLKRGVAPR